MASSDNGLLNDNIKEDDTLKDRYLTFMIDAEEYGIEIANIKEIIKISAITQVPHTPAYVTGIINLRGDIIPVIDVRKRFSKAPKDYDDLACIVVIEYGEYSLGLVVDRVSEVMVIDEANILPPPSAKMNYYNQFIRNIGRIDDTNLKFILDLEKFLNNE